MRRPGAVPARLSPRWGVRRSGTRTGLARHAPRIVARVAAYGAIGAAVVLVAVVLLGGGGYQVRAQFLNAGQLVKGNLVEVGGVQAGKVESFDITPAGVVEVVLSIDGHYAPLKPGTRAVIRQGSQASVAGKYIDLHMPPEDGSDEHDPGWRADRPGQHDHRRRVRPVPQHLRRGHARLPARLHQGAGPPVRRTGRGRQRGAPLPVPLARSERQAVPRARPRPGRARAVPRGHLPLRHRAG